MAYDEGSAQYYSYKEESVANTEESGSGGAILRRVTGQLQLAVAEVTSAEKRDDFQEVNVNHGTRSVNWAIAGELFGGDYSAFVAAMLRKAFAAVTQITAAITISSGVATRSTGSFISDGLKNGMIVRLGAMTTTGNLSRNVRISNVQALTMNVAAVDGGDPIADDAGPNASATVTIPGKYTYVPSTAHLKKTFTIEKYARTSDTSQIARGCKVGSMEISVQPDAPVGITFNGMGINRRNVPSGSSPVLTSPTAAGTGPAMSAGIGLLRANGAVVAAVTGLTLNLNNGISNLPVAFANTSPDIFYGRAIEVTGTLNFAKDGNTISNLFDEEAEFELEFYIAAPGSDPQAFVSVYMARVKLTADDEDDPDGPVIGTASFRALKKTSGTGYELTTILIQDSSVA